MTQGHGCTPQDLVNKDRAVIAEDGCERESLSEDVHTSR